MKPATLLALLATVLLWGSAFAGIRAVGDAYSPGQLALLRFLVASLAMLPAVCWRRFQLPARSDLPRLLMTGFFGVSLYHLALNYGQRTVDAGTACFVINLCPVFTALLAFPLLGERLRLRGWLGLGVSMIGIAMISLAGNHGIVPGPGLWAVLGAAFCSAIYMVVQKPLLTRLSPLTVAACSTWLGTILLMPFLPGLPAALRSAAPAATWTVVYLGVFPGALAYIFWSMVLRDLPASRAAPMLYAMPVVASAVAYFWLREIPAPLSLVGGLIALAGVVMINHRQRSENRSR